MRFSAAFPSPPRREPALAEPRRLPPPAEQPALQPQTPAFPGGEVPLDLDQRVRLTGEW